MILYEILGIILLHWIADFVLQSHEDAVGKYKSIKHLLNHTISYSIVMWLGIVTITSRIANIPLHSKWIDGIFLFWLITLVTHTLIDYFTSKWSHKLFKQKKYHEFFTLLGFDQVLHSFQLFITYRLLFL